MSNELLSVLATFDIGDDSNIIAVWKLHNIGTASILYFCLNAD